MFRTCRVSVALLGAAVFAVAGCRRDEVPPPPPATSASPADAPPTERVVGPLSEEDARALATMNDRLRDYVELHRQIERKVPALPSNATPEQIDASQRNFEKLIREARATAKQGDIFTPEAQPVIKRLLVAVFSGADGKQLRSSVMDENTVSGAALKLTVNSRYPDSVPLASVPAQILRALPELAEDMEYRFVGDWLILLDTHAHVIADYIDNALPK